MARYRKGTQIDAGGFGKVHSATRLDDDWECVIKSLKDDYDAGALRRFQREVRIQAQMDQTNIVPVVAMNLRADPPWFVMPKARSNLRAYLHGCQGEDQLPLFIGLAEGVQYAHENGMKAIRKVLPKDE